MIKLFLFYTYILPASAAAPTEAPTGETAAGETAEATAATAETATLLGLAKRHGARNMVEGTME